MLSEKIIGVWELQIWETVVDDRFVGYPLGQTASGFIAYHPIGFMSVNIAAPNRVRLLSDDPSQATKAPGPGCQRLSLLLRSVLNCVGERSYPPPKTLFV
jgi:hypothetical protein